MGKLVAPQTFDFAKYLFVTKASCDECLESLSVDVARGGIPATVRFQHLKFDSKTGEPMFAKLAECLADHLANYCFSAKRRGRPRTSAEHHKLHREAKALLRLSRTSGESGEALIYLLIEAILGAPQMVAKMDLKTNRRMESFGSDGIHMKWIEEEQALDVYFAEAKIEQRVSSAVTNAAASLQDFHANRQYDHELRLVTGHYKHADERTRTAVVRIIEGKEFGAECRIRHACLIGYEWSEYKDLPTLMARELTTEFQKRYHADRERLHGLIEKQFAQFAKKLLKFEIFFLPFTTVQKFRDAFYEAV